MAMSTGISTSLSTLAHELSVELLLSLDTDPAADTDRAVAAAPSTLASPPASWLPAAVEALHTFRDHG
jgi:hypothetical protein